MVKLQKGSRSVLSLQAAFLMVLLTVVGSCQASTPVQAGAVEQRDLSSVIAKASSIVSAWDNPPSGSPTPSISVSSSGGGSINVNVVGTDGKTTIIDSSGTRIISPTGTQYVNYKVGNAAPTSNNLPISAVAAVTLFTASALLAGTYLF